MFWSASSIICWLSQGLEWQALLQIVVASAKNINCTKFNQRSFDFQIGWLVCMVLISVPSQINSTHSMDIQYTYTVLYCTYIVHTEILVTYWLHTGIYQQPARPNVSTYVDSPAWIFLSQLALKDPQKPSQNCKEQLTNSDSSDANSQQSIISGPVHTENHYTILRKVKSVHCAVPLPPCVPSGPAPDICS